ncbi:hypothetical protein [Brucella sp. LJL56]
MAYALTNGQVEFKGNTNAANTKLLATSSGKLLFTGATTAMGGRVKLDGAASALDISGEFCRLA